jgi:FIMAH domain
LLNDPFWDAFYPQRAAGPDLQFAAGEHITMAAGLPAVVGPLSQVTLRIDGTVVQTTGFPGTVEYTFPAAGTHLVAWNVDGDATWTVSCEAAVGAFDPEQAITDLKDTVSGMELPKGLTTALNAKLNAALRALDADNHAGACTALQDFQNLVNAQTGKKLTEGQAGDLTDAATQIFEHICFT